MPAELAIDPTHTTSDPIDEATQPFAIDRTKLLISLGLAALAFAVYARTLNNGFISYDDYDYITSNPLIRQGLSWHGILQAFTTTDQANWFPMEWISLMATSQFFGLSPLAYHLTNLLLHAVNSVLLFLLLAKATGRIARSAVVAALFVAFPLNVEAVAWATERKSVLSVFFLLFALFGYGWYVRRPGALRYLAVVVPFALGLMTKALLVTFPFTLLLLDYWPLQRFGARRPNELPSPTLVVEKIPLFLMSFGSIFMTIYAAQSGGAFAIATAHARVALRVENSLWSYLDYILKGLWPAHLAIIYPFPQHLLPAWKIIAAAVFLFAVTGAAIVRRDKPYLLVGWLWYLGVLFPTIGLIQTGTQSMADRWAYVSFLGLFLLAVWSVADTAANIRIPPKALGALAAAILAACAWISFVQTRYWLNSYTIFEHAVEVTTANGPARVNLGVEFERMGHPELATQQYEQAVRDTPNLSTAHFNLARMYDDQHRSIEAIAEYEQVIANTNVGHEIAEAHTGLGAIYFNMSLTDKALAEFTAALGADPDQIQARVDRGLIEYRQGNLRAAEQDFTRSVELLPTPMTWFTLGLVYEGERNFEAAARAYEAALQMNPNLKDAQTHLQSIRQQSAR